MRFIGRLLALEEPVLVSWLVARSPFLSWSGLTSAADPNLSPKLTLCMGHRLLCELSLVYYARLPTLELHSSSALLVSQGCVDDINGMLHVGSLSWKALSEEVTWQLI